MVKVSAGTGIQSFVYDFAKDKGAIGSINSNLIMPRNAVVLQCISLIAVTLTGNPILTKVNIGIDASLNFYQQYGLQTAGTVISNVINLMPPLDATFKVKPVLFSITGAPLTGGKIIVSFLYMLDSMYCGDIFPFLNP